MVKQISLLLKIGKATKEDSWLRANLDVLIPVVSEDYTAIPCYKNVNFLRDFWKVFYGIGDKLALVQGGQISCLQPSELGW